MNPIETAKQTRDVIATQLARRDLYSAAQLVRTFQPEIADFAHPDTEQEARDRAQKERFWRDLDERRHYQALARIARKIIFEQDQKAQAENPVKRNSIQDRIDRWSDVFALVYGAVPEQGYKARDEFCDRVREADRHEKD